LEKPEITIKSISGGMLETQMTGKYPNYYTIRSRKYKRNWRLEKLPADLKI
jgi:hypothetical protein